MMLAVTRIRGLVASVSVILWFEWQSAATIGVLLHAQRNNRSAVPVVGCHLGAAARPPRAIGPAVGCAACRCGWRYVRRARSDLVRRRAVDRAAAGRQHAGGCPRRAVA